MSTGVYKIRKEMKKERKPTLDWIMNRAPWDAWGTFTFRGGNVGAHTCEKRVNEFLQGELPTVTYFYVIEQHKGYNAPNSSATPAGKLPGYHAHCLFRFGKELTNKLTTNINRSYTDDQARAAGHARKWIPYDKLWNKAFKKFGRCEFRPFKNLEDVTAYILKRVVDYQTKEVECKEHGLRFGNDYQGRQEAKSVSGPLDEDRILQVGSP